VISLVSFYQSSVFLSMSCKPLFFVMSVSCSLCHVDKLSIYVMWTSRLFMSCGQVVYLCHVDKMFIYVMWSNYLFYFMCTNFLFFISINYLYISCTQLVAVI
jgi:hypothetical protein